MQTLIESVFVLQHLHVLDQDDEDVKMIGVYRTREAALAAIARLSAQPGFCRHRALLESGAGGDRNGFSISEYQLDMDHWAQGYDTVT